MATVLEINGYYTVQEFAEYLQVSRSQATRYCQNDELRKKLEAVNVGKQWLIPERAARAFQRPPRGNPAFRKQRRKK